ncbi:hypothetical protein IT417_00465 [bacterium]|nr:hypothetical protein [bacterium]
MKNYKTPFFIFDDKSFRENIAQFTKIQSLGVDILFALKANNYFDIVNSLIKSGFGFDVASAEEIELALKSGSTPENISFSAPSKMEDDVEYAAKKGVKIFTVDSEEEILKIYRHVKNPLIFARIGTSNKAAAFNLSEKFGMTETYFKKIISKASKNGWNIAGVSFHIGSQNIDLSSWDTAIKTALSCIDYAGRKGIVIERLNLGGGIPAKYSPEVKPLDFYIDKLIARIVKLKTRHPNLKLYLEPGRAMVANVMTLYTKVIDIKPYKRPPLAVLDTSVFGGVIEALEGFEYPVTVQNMSKRGKLKYFKLGGYSCDGYDIIRQRVLLPSDLRVGEVIAIEQAGAYTSVFEQFQMKPFPKIFK